MSPVVFIILFSILFFIALPGLGAFQVRNHWRRFRQRLLEASFWPIADYSSIGSKKRGIAGNYRFFGTLEAIQEDDIIWLRNGDISISVDMTDAYVYMLAPYSADPETRDFQALNDEMPQRVPWDKVFSLHEGASVFICGTLFVENGRGIFRPNDTEDLQVIIYDGPSDRFLRRAIWSGRQRNEYWNSFTPGSLAAGALAFLALSYFLLKFPLLRYHTIVSISFILVPILPFIPPGIVLFLFYRRFWKEAWFFRAERDMLLLSLRFFTNVTFSDKEKKIPCDNGETYLMREVSKEELLENKYNNIEIRRSPMVLRLLDKEPENYYLFGVQQQGDQVFGTSKDPMVNRVALPGNPMELANECHKKARFYERLSLGIFLAGFLVNMVVVFAVVAALIR